MVPIGSTLHQAWRDSLFLGTDMGHEPPHASLTHTLLLCFFLTPHPSMPKLSSFPVPGTPVPMHVGMGTARYEDDCGYLLLTVFLCTPACSWGWGPGSTLSLTPSGTVSHWLCEFKLWESYSTFLYFLSCWVFSECISKKVHMLGIW